jgi:hypothetical protein
MKRLAVVLAALCVFALAGAALASGTLSGKYKTTISSTTPPTDSFNGTWAINFKQGTYHETFDGKAAVHGKYTIKKHVIALTDAPGPDACPTKGKYKFTLKGKTLKFTRIHDSTSGNCLARTVVFSQTFEKV